MQKFCSILFFVCFWQATNAQELITYSAPQAVIYSMHNDDYTVKVRKPGGQWQDLFEYNVKVDMDKPQDASMVYFDFSGTVEIFVRKNNGKLQSVKLRPSSYEIKPLINSNTITFTLNESKKISIEFNDDKLHNLHLFANGIEKNRSDSNDANVIYFGPGVHYPKDSVKKTFNIPSGKTVYIAGGAVVRGKFICDSVQNVRIIGRGIIDKPQEGVAISFSKNIEIEGIIFINPAHYTVSSGASKNITIRNIKSFSSQGWSDGLDFMSCSDVVIDDVFMRNSDDCIAIYGHRWKFYGNAKNYSVANSTLWADIAHPINIGTHGNTNIAGDTIENIVFKNIDILEQDEDDPEYEGCLALSVGDFNLVRNVRFENIRVDDFEEGQLLNLRVIFNRKYNTGPGRGIENIYFKDITYYGINNSPSIINGLDKDHMVKGVTFENLRINGKIITTAAEGNIKTGEFTKGVVFKK
jgi:polygalacturonase